ncbi:MAG: hypothetical protein RIB80_04600 [Rhodospirillales bacterium]
MSGGGAPAQAPVPATQTVKNVTEIPAFLEPFVKRQAEIGVQALERLPGLLEGGGRLTAGLDPLEQTAQSIRINRANTFDPSAAFQTTRDLTEATARGDFLFGGEGFDAAVDAAVRRAQPAILSSFGAAGRSNSGLAQAAIAQQATDAFANQHQVERQRQLAAASSLPQLNLAEFDAGFTQADILGQVGAQRRALAMQEQLAPITAEETLLSAIGGGVPLGAVLGQSSVSNTSGGYTPSTSNRLAGVLGGGLAGLGAASSLFPASAAASQAGGLAAFSSLGPLGLLGFGAGGALLGGLLS